ncbi:hypothetical protein DFH28DRAFT_514537 [Melampsora americana]|nr:hypothetical protein DFH28DRAFT_514537 [Melampsora americana]
MNPSSQLAHHFLEILSAIFPLEGELIMNEQTSRFLHDSSIESTKEPNKLERYPTELNFKLRVNLSKDLIKPSSQVDALYIACSLDLETSVPQLWLDRHSHLDHSSWEALSCLIKDEIKSEFSIINLENLTETLTHLSQKLPEWFQNIESSNLSKLSTYPLTHLTISENPSSLKLEDHHDQFYTRAWFKFPSLSSKSKRNELVKLAREYSMTGFVKAGKPGWITIEIESNREIEIERYWSEIKTNSWADIPSFQKKVTELIRERKVNRQFLDMKEVTDLMNSKNHKKSIHHHHHHHHQLDDGEKEEMADWLRKLGISEEILLVVLGFSRV